MNPILQIQYIAIMVFLLIMAYRAKKSKGDTAFWWTGIAVICGMIIF